MPEPPFWGSAIRVRELVLGLSRRHSVTLVAYHRPWEDTNFDATRDLCDSFHPVAATWPEGPDRAGRLRSLFSLQPHPFRLLAGRPMQTVVDDILAAETHDLVQVESSQISGLDLSRAPVTILDEHNVEYEVLSRGLAFERSLPRKAFGAAEYVKVRHAERRAWRSFDGCAVTSEREAAEVASFNSGRPLAVVPNGVDLERFAPQPATSRSGIVFTGLMRYRPNVDAVTYFVREVLPRIHDTRPDVTLTIVGWGVTDEIRSLLGPRVIATDRVPDVRPYLAGAAVVVAPIRSGSGTRLKVLEALAMARPLVATTQACEGLGLADGRDLLVADDPRRFADSVLRVLGDPAYGERLGNAGRSTVASRYGWGHSVELLEELHERVMAARHRPPKHALAPAVVEAGAGRVH